ncbi:hypothetical protein F5887DRAFT_186671 [Amanita rubescens]|nr:hypothetical protein F5887DRAFT_186671 [Amanita rubescens]
MRWLLVDEFPLLDVEEGPGRTAQNRNRHDSHFAGVDWEAMRNKTLLPPWVPDFVKGHHFFEDWGTIEHFIPGRAPNEDEEVILLDFVYTSLNLQCNDIKDTLDCGSPNPERDTNEESLNSILSNSQQNFPRDSFGHLFASEPEDDMDEGELCTLEIDDNDNDDTLPVNEVKARFPMISTLEPHIPMLLPVHSVSSLLCLVESDHVPEPMSVQVEYCVPESAVESNVVPESHVSRLLRFAMPPSVALSVDFARPAPFQSILEPLVNCVPKEQLDSSLVRFRCIKRL